MHAVEQWKGGRPRESTAEDTREGSEAKAEWGGIVSEDSLEIAVGGGKTCFSRDEASFFSLGASLPGCDACVKIVKMPTGSLAREAVRKWLVR